MRPAQVHCRQCGNLVPFYYVTSSGDCWDCMDGGFVESLGYRRQDRPQKRPPPPTRSVRLPAITEPSPPMRRFATILVLILLPLALAFAGPVTMPATNPVAPATQPAEPPILWAVAATADHVQLTFDRTGQPGRFPLTDQIQTAMLAATRPAVPSPPPSPPATNPATIPTTQPATNPTPPTPPVVPVPPTPPNPVARFPPPAGSTAVYAGQPLPAVVNNVTVALERGGKWTQSVELRGARPALIAFGDPAKPAPVIESPANADFCVGFFGNAVSVLIQGIELRPAHPTADARGDGLVIKGSTSEKLLIKDVWVRWFEQNITLTGRHHLPELNGVRSGYAWAPPGNGKLFKGQGVYNEFLSEPLTIVGCLLDHNGYPDGPEDQRRNNYRHAVYDQFGNAKQIVIGCIVSRNACVGLQLREDGDVSATLFAHNGISVLTASSRAAGSLVTIRGCGFVGADCYWSATSWTGAMHLSAYAPTQVADSVMVRVPGATANLPVYQVPDPKRPGKRIPSRAFELGAIAVSFAHPDEKAHGHGSITFKNVTVAGYAAPNAAPLPVGAVASLTGDLARQTPLAGLTTLPTAGPCDVSDLIAKAWIGGDVAALAQQGIARAKAAAGK